MRKAKLFIGVTAGVFIFWSGTIINSSQLDNQNTESSFGSILLVIGIALTLLSFLYIISNSNRVLSILDKVLLASITYLFIEIFLLILTLGGWFSPTSTVIAENSIYVWNKPCAKYDSIAGYKWVDSFRVVSMNTDEVHFDEIIHSNKQGYVSYQDYLPHKKDSTISRYIVLGDSFTAGAYLKTSWPDYCQKQLSSDTSITPVELYNFSVDGGGIHNWHSIFFNEVVPQYEFDAVIIAIFPGDLSRDFFILNHQEDSTAKYGYFKQKPASRQDFNLTFLPKMEPVGS
ncbi:MAG: SGNH/GDSL hydrolase family protein, partial [Bacteroidetes bacterium]|nr:SGNH/GDSL hydrolase family protein [Bacteroidota bacterium]